MRKKKKSLVFIITLLIMCFGIGYAYLTTTLSINGVTDVDANNWDVYFDNANVTTGSVTGDQVIEAPTITSDTEVEFHVRLKEPGEFYEFTIDAKNDGTIDAMIDSITKKVNGGTTIPAYLRYDVTYQDGQSIENKHMLAAESLETLKIRVEYRTDINPSDLPTSAQSLTLSFDVEYVQADENAGPRILYSFILASTNPIHVGDTIPASGDDSYNYLVSSDPSVVGARYEFFSKHYMSGTIIQKNSLIFYYNNVAYELLGGDSGASYERNKQVVNNMVTALGIDFNCNDYSNSYSCRSTVYNGLNNWYFDVYDDGRVSISKGSFYVEISADGSSQTDDMS